MMIYGSLDTLSGGYMYDREMVRCLMEHGDGVEIISIQHRGYLDNLIDNLSSPLLRRLKGLDVDVLLQDELTHPSLFMLNHRLRKQVDYPIVSIVHHLRCSEGRPAWQNRFYNGIERRYLSGVDGFIYNSQTTRSVVENLLAGSDLPCLVAYPGGDRLHPQVTGAEIARRVDVPTLNVLFLGNLIPRKGLHVLLEALKELPAAGWKLTVVGDGRVNPSYADAIGHLVSRNGLEKNVHFTGILGDHELADRIKASHLIAMPSSYEGYGIAYLEAMGFGLPAIGTTAGAAGETVTHGRDGFLIMPGDSGSLAGYLGDVLHDRQRLLEMSLAARERYLRHPTWDDSMNNIRAFLADFRRP